MNCKYWSFYVHGLFLAFAYEDMSYKKVANQSKTYAGPNVEASNAVDGNIATCMRTIVIGPSSVEKTVWWKVDLGGVYNIYSINILFKNYDGYVQRQRGRFAGFSLYVSNYDVSSIADIKDSTLCYKDGPQLPPLNFTRICTVKGRYVIYYNERLDGVIYPEGYGVVNVYTELCEVIVQGCRNASLYGSNCDTPCPTNCKDNTCHIQSGACFTCKTGWTGTYCNTKCGEGWYGVNCSQHCVGHCKDYMICNHVTGQCDEGCATGWTGTMCNKECKDGTYGHNCVKNCSSHCLNDSHCNKQTGHCNGGCDPGYTNGDCSKECPAGQFGFSCSKRCSEQCLIKDLCDHVNGECTSGCLDGFVGTHCNKSCSKGYFGSNCSQVCSPNCKLETCRPTDGSCICAADLTDNNCTIDGISYKKVATQSHTYPGTGYNATNAVDGNPGTCMRTDVIGSNSVEKTVWWKVDLGGIFNIYKTNIQFKTYEGFECSLSYGENWWYPCSVNCINQTRDRINGSFAKFTK